MSRAICLALAVLTLSCVLGRSGHAQTSVSVVGKVTGVSVLSFKDSPEGPGPDQAADQQVRQQFVETEWRFALQQGQSVGGLTISRNGQPVFPVAGLFIAADAQLTRALFHFGDQTQVINGEFFKNSQNPREGLAVFYVTRLPSSGGYATTVYVVASMALQ